MRVTRQAFITAALLALFPLAAPLSAQQAPLAPQPGASTGLRPLLRSNDSDGAFRRSFVRRAWWPTALAIAPPPGPG